MARTTPRPDPTAQGTLLPLTTACPACGGALSLDFYNERTHRHHPISAEQLAPTDLDKWRPKREEMGRRRRARAEQRRFRRDTDAFLQELEGKLTQSRLPS